MTKKKSFLCSAFALVVMLPCIFLLTACGTDAKYKVSEDTWIRQTTSPVNYSSNDKYTVLEFGNLYESEGWYINRVFVDGQKIQEDLISDTVSIHSDFYEQTGETYKSFFWVDALEGEEWYFEVNTGSIMDSYDPSNFATIKELHSQFSKFRFNSQTKTYDAIFDNYSIVDYSTGHKLDIINSKVSVSFENNKIKSFKMTADEYKVTISEAGISNVLLNLKNFESNILFGVGDVTLPEATEYIEA